MDEINPYGTEFWGILAVSRGYTLMKFCDWSAKRTKAVIRQKHSDDRSKPVSRPRSVAQHLALGGGKRSFAAAQQDVISTTRADVRVSNFCSCAGCAGSNQQRPSKQRLAASVRTRHDVGEKAHRIAELASLNLPPEADSDRLGGIARNSERV